MNIKQRLNKEPNIEETPLHEQGSPTIKEEDVVVELLKLVPLTYEVVENVIDRKYPFEELLIEEYDGIILGLRAKELKRRSYKIGFNKKVDSLCSALPELVDKISTYPKDYLLMNSLRVVEENGERYVGADYQDNTLLYYIKESSEVQVVLLDKVEVPFLYEVTSQANPLDLGQQEDIDEEDNLEEEESTEQSELFKRLVESTKPFIEDTEQEKGLEEPKLSSKDININVLSEEEQKRLEAEIMEKLSLIEE